MMNEDEHGIIYNYYLACAIAVNNSKVMQAMIIAFAAFILHSDSVYAFDGSKYQEVCSKTLEMVHGGFGALLMASAGVGAVVASAAGGFRIAWALVVVALGAFTLKEYQELWFEPC